jgi:hydroxymethylbilane synthase
MISTDLIRPFVIATRPSKLALRQTELVLEHVHRHWPDAQIEIRAIRSEGDIRQTEVISQFGDKGVFVARIEQALLDGEADVAVHSLKDLPGESAGGRTELPLRIVAYLPRDDPRDVLVTRDGLHFAELPPGTRIGTSSLRRRMQLVAVRPDLAFVNIRGNVDTRLRKLESGAYDALVLAAAGLIRLGMQNVITQYLDPELCLPAPGQGIIAVQCRAGDPLGDQLVALDDADAHAAARAERALARAIGANCTTPLGALAHIHDDTIVLEGALVGADGTVVRAQEAGLRGDEVAIAARVAARLQRLAETTLPPPAR